MTRALPLLVILATSSVATAAEVTVLCPRGLQHVVATLAEEFQRDTKHSVWLSYGTTAGILGRALTENMDIVIGSATGVAELEGKGAVRPASRVILGRVAVGVAVRAGAPRPDVSTVATLKRTILEAPSLAYADPALGGQAGRHVSRVLERLGIAALVAPKTTLVPDGPRGLESVAKGQIAIAVAPVSEIMSVEGLALAGLLPAELQQIVVYAAGVLTRSAAPDVAKAFLDHLTRAEARARFKAGGIEVGP